MWGHKDQEYLNDGRGEEASESEREEDIPEGLVSGKIEAMGEFSI